MSEQTGSPWRRIRVEITSGRQWIDRGVVIAYAVVTGLVVVAFTLLAEAASDAFLYVTRLRPAGAWAPLVWTPLLTVVVLWLTRRFAAGTEGSGIPQVIAAIEYGMPDQDRRRLVSLRLSAKKVLLVCAGIFAGLSIGREGPTVQVGAGVMQHARRWLSSRSNIDTHDLIVAGAAAGIAAAFNTPLGGIVFAIEQLSRRRGFSQSGLVILSIVMAGLVAVSMLGNLTYFGALNVESIGWAYAGPALAIAVVSGLAGGLFSRLIVASLMGLPDRWSRFRARHPYRFAAGCAVAVAVIGIVTEQATSAAGYAPTRALLEGHDDLPALYTVLKFCATWLSAWTGVPAGVFAPSLAIGAGIGRDIAGLAHMTGPAMIPLIAFGMVGFLSASTQGPLTAFIIVMEMVAGQSMVLSLMAVALVATGVSRLITAPMFFELAALLAPPDSTSPR
jgi:chloride channel protein, CIC family